MDLQTCLSAQLSAKKCWMSKMTRRSEVCSRKFPLITAAILCALNPEVNHPVPRLCLSENVADTLYFTLESERLLILSLRSSCNDSKPVQRKLGSIGTLSK